MSSVPSYSARTLIDGRKTVAAAATPEPLTTTVTWVDYVDIIALDTNQGEVAVGASTVVQGASQRGYHLDAGDVATLHDVDLSKVYVDVATNGEGVAYVGVSR